MPIREHVRFFFFPSGSYVFSSFLKVNKLVFTVGCKPRCETGLIAVKKNKTPSTLYQHSTPVASPACVWTVQNSFHPCRGFPHFSSFNRSKTYILRGTSCTDERFWMLRFLYQAGYSSIVLRLSCISYRRVCIKTALRFSSFFFFSL